MYIISEPKVIYYWFKIFYYNAIFCYIINIKYLMHLEFIFIYYIVFTIVISPGKNSQVGSHSLLQGTFPCPLNTGLLNCRQIPYHLSHCMKDKKQ